MTHRPNCAAAGPRSRNHVFDQPTSYLRQHGASLAKINKPTTLANGVRQLQQSGMQITVAQGAVKHQLSVEGEETVRAVKARLEELCSIPAVQQKLLVKGKEAADARLAAAELDPALRQHPIPEPLPRTATPDVRPSMSPSPRSSSAAEPSRSSSAELTPLPSPAPWRRSASPTARA